MTFDLIDFEESCRPPPDELNSNETDKIRVHSIAELFCLETKKSREENNNSIPSNDLLVKKD